jgi:hypothetical protein
MVAIVSTKDDWTLPLLWHKWQYTGITEFLLFLCPIKTKVEDVLLKSRMRENFMSGSVRGLIVTSESILQYEVDYEPYSTAAEKNN